MTLKKCTVRQLDETFWRVDWEGPWSTEDGPLDPPLVFLHLAKETWQDPRTGGYGPSLDERLGHYGLTRHDPKPETAEGRAREMLGHTDTPDEMTVEDSCYRITYGDLRAILGELDRVRAQRPVDAEKQRIAAEYCRIATEVMEKAFDCQVAADCFCHESGNMPCFNHSDAVIGFVRDAVRAKIDGGAQPPVDVEAVLAPFRSAKLRATADRKKYGCTARESVEDGSYRFGAEDAWMASEQWVVEQVLTDALAEAEKIGRGQ